MTTIKQQFNRFVKVLGIVAVVAAFAALAFPTAGFAAPVTDNNGGLPGKLVVSVYDGEKGSAVSGAVVYIYGSSSMPIAKGETTLTGQATFSLAPGSYTIKVAANGYNTASGVARVGAGTTTEAGFKLQVSSISPVTR